MTRRIMRKFKITEISGCDTPAQVGARVVIMKRFEQKELPNNQEFISRAMEALSDEFPNLEQRMAAAHFLWKEGDLM
jgi:hypothetical protein